jgi:hypothetical protein
MRNLLRPVFCVDSRNGQKYSTLTNNGMEWNGGHFGERRGWRCHAVPVWEKSPGRAAVKGEPGPSPKQGSAGRQARLNHVGGIVNRLGIEKVKKVELLSLPIPGVPGSLTGNFGRQLLLLDG